MFTDKPRQYMDDGDTGLRVIAFTEPVFHICAAILFVVHDEYILWYIPLDIVALACRLCMVVEVPIGSRVNVRDLLELLKAIYSTQFSLLPTVWRDCTYRAVDYNPGPVDEGAHFVFFETWHSGKVDEKTAGSRALATRVAYYEVPYGFLEVKEDVERMPSDECSDHNAYVQVEEGMAQYNIAIGNSSGTNGGAPHV